MYRELDTLGLKTIDLTCPYVQKLHTIVARYSETGRTVILVGSADHPEVVGTLGWCKGSVYTVHADFADGTRF